VFGARCGSWLRPHRAARTLGCTRPGRIDAMPRNIEIKARVAGTGRAAPAGARPWPTAPAPRLLEQDDSFFAAAGTGAWSCAPSCGSLHGRQVAGQLIPLPERADATAARASDYRARAGGRRRRGLPRALARHSGVARAGAQAASAC
jgi:hypothetical protein